MTQVSGDMTSGEMTFGRLDRKSSPHTAETWVRFTDLVSRVG